VRIEEATARARVDARLEPGACGTLAPEVASAMLTETPLLADPPSAQTLAANAASSQSVLLVVRHTEWRRCI